MGCNCKGSKEPVINEEIGTKLVIDILVNNKIPTEEEKGLLFLYYDMIYKTRTRVNNETYQLIAMKLLDRYNQNK